MAAIPKRIARLMKQLDVPTPDEVRDFYRDNGQDAADEVRKVLDEIIAEINDKSSTGALRGYRAQVLDGAKATLDFPGSRFTSSGIFQYFVLVEASRAHQGQDLNVFNVLDAGRPQLKKRQPGSPYVLWGAPLHRGSRSNPRITGTATRLSIKDRPQAGGLAQGRPEPRSSQDRGAPMAFSLGPLRATEPQFLYQAALRRAKDRLSGTGFTNWDVIFAGNPDG